MNFRAKISVYYGFHYFHFALLVQILMLMLARKFKYDDLCFLFHFTTFCWDKMGLFV